MVSLNDEMTLKSQFCLLLGIVNPEFSLLVLKNKNENEFYCDDNKSILGIVHIDAANREGLG